MTLCFYHDANVAHDPGPGHSERAERLGEIYKALRAADLPNFDWVDAPLGDRAPIERVHTKRYVDFVFDAVPADGYREIEVNEVISDDDGGEVTVLCPRSGEAVLRNTGMATASVDAVMTGSAENAFCLARPPGHHALPDKAMGFCVFNNIAVAARYAQDRHGAKRVAIVDFDVHHGNGTQAIFETDPSVFFASIHQLPLWPESGYAGETGCGNILNVPVAPDTTREDWLAIWRQQVLGRLEKEPFDLLLISAGFDAHHDDIKGSQNLLTDDYRTITRELMDVAARKCGGRVIAFLEGGYDVAASAASAVATARALCGG